LRKSADDFVEPGQFSVGNAFGLHVKQVEQLEALGIGHRGSRSKSNCRAMVGIFGAGASMRQSQPFKNGLDVGFGVRRNALADVRMERRITKISISPVPVELLPVAGNEIACSSKWLVFP
jgi:hypothetical protein